jgi:hypothetical protein
VLRALRRAAAAVALAALFAGTAGALLAADRQDPPAPRAMAGGQTRDRPGTDGGQSRDRQGTDGGQSPGRVAKRPVAEVRWRHSRSTGLHWGGRLADGVRLPAEGRTFFTWDPILRRSPNRAWRRWGNDRLIRTLVDVLDAFAAAHPEAPRVGVGDVSRPHGGDFGPRYGLPGHVSHQNGLDADLYYPRLDRRERAPDRPAQIDRRLAQELVDRFVAAGAVRVFVGPNTGLRGPPGIVQALVHHDNHLHVRLPQGG